jgi:hypothetical protein
MRHEGVHTILKNLRRKMVEDWRGKLHGHGLKKQAERVAAKVKEIRAAAFV